MVQSEGERTKVFKSIFIVSRNLNVRRINTIVNFHRGKITCHLFRQSIIMA